MTPLVKKILVDSDRHKITMAQNSRKRYLLLPINHIIIKLQWHTKVYVKMFDDHVNIKVPQTIKMKLTETLSIVEKFSHSNLETWR